MFNETADHLARKRADAARKGADFPTVWHTLLKSRPLDGLVTASTIPIPRPLILCAR